MNFRDWKGKSVPCLGCSEVSLSLELDNANLLIKLR